MRARCAFVPAVFAAASVLMGCRPDTIHPLIYVDNATDQYVAVEVDGESWGVVAAGAYQPYDDKPMRKGAHTMVIRNAEDRREMERRTETIDGHGPWVLNVLGAQTYLHISDYDFHDVEKFDIRSGHRQRWFKGGGFDLAAPSPAFGMFLYRPTGKRLLRWSQIPESRRMPAVSESTNKS